MKTRVIQDDAEPAENGINLSAPVVASSETEIVAAREVVWHVLTRIEQWPTWNPDVKSVSMDGGLHEVDAENGPKTLPPRSSRESSARAR